MVSTINEYWIRKEAKRTCPFLERIDINWNGGEKFTVNGVCTKELIRMNCGNGCAESSKAARISLLCEELSLIEGFSNGVK